MKTSIILSVLLAGGMIYGAYYLTSTAPSGSAQIINNSGPGGNIDASKAVVVDENGTQIITITAGRGYFPQSVTAKADLPSVIRMVSTNSYSCAAFLVIPSLKFQGNLSASAPTDIPVPAQKAGEVIRGTCAMGMYSFAIKFE
ncbi:MAG: hypothetical protein WC757_00660 [Candidatus Paceibacterota bacterium]|jgi:hypothetical protein